MNTIKKRKIKNFIKKYKKILIGGGLFGILGVGGLILGFEIANDWHAIRDFLNSPYAVTLFIILGVGAALLVFLIATFVMLHTGEDD